MLSRLLATGYSPAIALNSDGPTLAFQNLLCALERLRDADVVLGPSEDGGYYLIGLKKAQPGLFQGIDWSTKRVTVQTLARAEDLGLAVAMLPQWYDVDAAADLWRLLDDLARLPGDVAPNARRCLCGLGVGADRTGTAGPDRRRL